MKARDIIRLVIVICISIALSFLFLHLANEEKKMEPYISTLSLFFTVLVGLGTFSLAAVTFVDFRKKREIEELSFWSSLDIEIIPSGTITLTNKGKEAIKIDKVQQDIIPLHKMPENAQRFRQITNENTTRYKNLENKLNLLVKEEAEILKRLYNKRIKELKEEFIKKDDWKCKNEYISDVLLNPNNKLNIPDSMTYDLHNGMYYYFSYILLMRIYQSKNGNEVKYIDYIFRYSQYEPPEGWVRIG